jgi:hypothetical protein
MRSLQTPLAQIQEQADPWKGLAAVLATTASIEQEAPTTGRRLRFADSSSHGPKSKI